jgi:hypothetical protein
MRMGCMNKDKIYLFRYAISTRKLDNKLLFVLLVTFIMIATTTPIVLAASEDNVIITFDPNGDIDIDISLARYNFSIITAGMWANSTGGAFTLYNNGTVPMNTQIRTNATTDETDMSLNATGVPPTTDEYAIYIEDVDFPNYLTTAYGTIFDQGLASSDSKTFDICLYLGVNLSANYSWQTTTIYFRGSVS